MYVNLTRNHSYVKGIKQSNTKILKGNNYFSNKKKMDVLSVFNYAHGLSNCGTISVSFFL